MLLRKPFDFIDTHKKSEANQNHFTNKTTSIKFNRVKMVTQTSLEYAKESIEIDLFDATV